MSILFASIGGFFGASARYVISLLFRRLGKPGHMATVLVNWIGSFLLGWAAHAAWLYPVWEAVLTAGFLGAFTTFSTFMFDVVELMEKDQRLISILYLAATLIGGLLLFIVGWNL